MVLKDEKARILPLFNSFAENAQPMKRSSRDYTKTNAQRRIPKSKIELKSHSYSKETSRSSKIEFNSAHGAS